MEFDQDAFERLSPEVRIEVQTYYLLRDTKRRQHQALERRGRPVATATRRDRPELSCRRHVAALPPALGFPPLPDPEILKKRRTE